MAAAARRRCTPRSAANTCSTKTFRCRWNMKTTARTTSTWAAKPAPSRPACATTSKRAPSGPDATVVEVLAPPRPRKKGTVAIPCLSAFNAAETARKLHRQRLVADAFRLGAFFAQAFLLVGFVFLIVAVEEGHLRIAFERQDMGGDAVQEPAIVRDHHHRAGELQQRVFQRAQGFDVQIVRRFIEQQHVAALEQGLGQVQTAAFAAGQVADDLLLVRTL